MEPKQPVWVYGADHSPWVQAVLLGLHDRRVPHTVVTVPPLSMFLDSGVLMPAAKFGDAAWIRDSTRILEALGYAPVAEEDRAALSRVFGAGALERTRPAAAFWLRWSYVRDGHPRLARRCWNHVWRSFAVLHFFVSISLARRLYSVPSREALSSVFGYWNDRLGNGAPFLAGGRPETVDLQLFGHVQMFASVPGDALDVLRSDPALGHLRAWVECMHERFADYDHLYSGPYFAPRLPPPAKARRGERALYWLGCTLMVLAFPLTVSLSLFYSVRVQRKGWRGV